jgi:hypothetical protein
MRPERDKSSPKSINFNSVYNITAIIFKPETFIEGVENPVKVCSGLLPFGTFEFSFSFPVTFIAGTAGT